MFRIHSYPEEIFIRYSAFYDKAGAAALATPIIGLAIVLIIIQVKYLKNKKHITIRTGSLVAKTRNNSVSLYIYSIIAISVLLPIAVLFLQAGSPISFKLALENSFQDFQTTLMVAAITATCATVFSYFIVHFLESLSSIQKSSFEILTFIPFAFPATFVGIGLIYLWNTETTGLIYGSWTILILACLARFLPFTIRIMDVSLKQLDPKLREAASFCKTSLLKKWYCIDIPLMRRGLLACWIVTFILCTGELGTTLLLIPPGSGTVSLKIYTLMHYGAGPLVAALALILIAVNLIISTGLLLPNRAKHI
jgi:iron(III) transport system permease protein